MRQALLAALIVFAAAGSPSAQSQVTYSFSYVSADGLIQPFSFQVHTTDFLTPGPFAIDPFTFTDGLHSWTMTQAQACKFTSSGIPSGVGEFEFGTAGSTLRPGCSGSSYGGTVPALFVMTLNTNNLPTGPGTFVSGGPVGSPFFARNLIFGAFPDPAGPFGYTQLGEARGIVTIGVSTGLTAPTNLRATQSGTSGNQIVLTWDYGSDPIDKFNIYRIAPSDPSWPALPPSGSAVPIATIPFGLGPYGTSDTVSAAYGSYAYWVTASKDGRESSPSNLSTVFQIRTSINFDVDANGTICQTCAVEATFTPNPSSGGNSLSAFAHSLGYDHFDWISVVDVDPEPPIDPSNPTQPLFTPYIDPPPGGYLGGRPHDDLPLYWDEVPGLDGQGGAPFYYLNYTSASSMRFKDIPVLAGPTLPSQYLGFITALHGIRPNGSLSPPLTVFNWYSNYNGWTGGVGVRSNLDLPTAPSTGGVFNVSIADGESLPLDIRAVLIKAGVQGVATTPVLDKTPPITANFLLGSQGLNSWFTGPVSVTLIATDISGLSSTSYSVDGAPSIGYSVPFTVFNDGTHTIQFRSVDKAGNVETVKSVTFMIDSTPPAITASRNIPANANGWNNSPVTVTFQCSDALSGLAAGSPPAPVTLAGNGAAQSATGSCRDLAGNSSSTTTQPMNIDLATPTITVAASAPMLWPPNGRVVPDMISGVIGDGLSGIDPSTATFRVMDEYGRVQPTGPVVIGPGGVYSFTVNLEASRLGQDLDGRHYQIIVSASDRAGNQASAATMVTVPHDQGK